MNSKRKEKIYSYIKSKEYLPLKFDELASVLCVPEEDIKEFSKILDELILEGRIFLTKKNRYEAIKKDMLMGVLQCNPHGRFAFLRSLNSDEEIFIGGDKLSGALHNDTVMAVIDVHNPLSGKKEGHITKILKRGNERLTGVIKREHKGVFLIVPDNKRIYSLIKADVFDGVMANVGDRVLVEITGYNDDILGVITKNLGDSSELKSNVDAIIQEYSIKEEFDEKTLEEAQKAPKRVSQKDIEGRLDLRDKKIFTIDGDDARDFDDAVSVEVVGEEYILGVHIADVTNYVSPNTSLDDEAFQRGTSVYLADRVIPMLPLELSNGICSLNPNVNRLTLSVFMRIDKKGNVSFESLKKSVIRSCERLTYNDVADLLENQDKKLLKKYQYILPDLLNMQELAKILYERRKNRGSINFDFPEAEIITNDIGEPVDIIKSERRISHKMIEEFMLCANETIAEMAFWAELPFVFRVHEPPSIEKIQDFNKFLYNFGYSLKGKIDEDNPVHPKAFAQIMEKIQGSNEEIIISTYMLRSLMKAEYKDENLGHFGLSAKYYCHFTSPIRRYPDLMIHRILKDYIDCKDAFKYEKIVGEASRHSSDKELDAEYCERDVDDLMKAAYMSKFIGEDFSARVSSVTNFGMFVQLDNTIEGLIRLADMKDDYYEFDENAKIIRGNRFSREYRIGDKIEVVLISAKLSERQIDFVRKEDFDKSIIKRERKREEQFSNRRKKRGNREYTRRKKRKR